MAGKHGSSAKTELQPLQKFCPMMEDDVIRIGGRLQRSHLPLDFKHPIVLPKRHHVTGLVILYTHRKGGHNAAQYVLNTVRERFYVIGQERTVKYYIKKDCLVCRYQHAKPGTQLMAPLPLARVEAGNKTFETCGVDYMGPLEVRQGRNQLKRYCCVFTCLASRATHVKMTDDLTTESFLMALRRFLSIRGHSTRTIHSDNGTNFVGARQELVRGVQRLNQQKIINELSPQSIKWVHAPPLASHQGGIYEAVIRLVQKTIASLMAERHLRILTDEGVSAQSFFTCSYLESNLYLCCVSLQGYFFLPQFLIFTFMRCCEQQEISACCVAKLHLICILFDQSLFTLLRFLVFADGNL